jgi:hypothetical protein
MSPQQVDMATEETDFMTEFRIHDLELSPIRSNSCTQNEEMSKQREIENLDLKIKLDINLEKSRKNSSVKDFERGDDSHHHCREALVSVFDHLCYVNQVELHDLKLDQSFYYYMYSETCLNQNGFVTTFCFSDRLVFRAVPFKS